MPAQQGAFGQLTCSLDAPGGPVAAAKGFRISQLWPIHPTGETDGQVLLSMFYR